MTDLIPTINDIINFGLHTNLALDNKERLLEKALVKIYSLSFEIIYEFDEAKYPDYVEIITCADIRQNVISNFKDYGFYKSVIDSSNLDNLESNVIGDAIDDLTDIISDLLEVKWRIENNSMADGLWYFDLIFYSHTKQHIIGLLDYINQRNSYGH